MVKSLVNIICLGAKILLKALHKSILQEIQQSREAARLRYHTERSENSNNHSCQQNNDMSLAEAKLILNIDDLCPKNIEQKYQYLFQANGKQVSGSLYLQSKVFRAKERLILEIKRKEKELKKSKNIKLVER